MTDSELRKLAESAGFHGSELWWKMNLPRFRKLITPPLCPRCFAELQCDCEAWGVPSGDVGELKYAIERRSNGVVK